MRLNRKDEAKSQENDEIKIYDGYIRLIGFSNAAMSLVPPLRISSIRIAVTKMPRANRLRLVLIFFLSLHFPSSPSLRDTIFRKLEVCVCPHALNGIKLAPKRVSLLLLNIYYVIYYWII